MMYWKQNKSNTNIHRFFQVKPIAEVDGSTGRNMKADRLLSKCNFYFCLLGKTKFDHMLVIRERK